MKYSGLIGFATTVETSKGVWDDQITEKRYFGDVLRHAARWESGESVNDNFRVSNRLSVVADGYFRGNLGKVRYAEWMGTKWKIADVTVEPPRIILTLGGEWNGPTA